MRISRIRSRLRYFFVVSSRSQAAAVSRVTKKVKSAESEAASFSLGTIFCCGQQPVTAGSCSQQSDEEGEICRIRSRFFLTRLPRFLFQASLDIEILPGYSSSTASRIRSTSSPPRPAVGESSFGLANLWSAVRVDGEVDVDPPHRCCESRHRRIDPSPYLCPYQSEAWLRLRVRG